MEREAAEEFEADAVNRADHAGAKKESVMVATGLVKLFGEAFAEFISRSNGEGGGDDALRAGFVILNRIRDNLDETEGFPRAGAGGGEFNGGVHALEGWPVRF